MTLHLQQNKHEILHIGTGGTISAVKGGHGIAPAYKAEELSQLILKKRPKLKNNGSIKSVTLMHKDSSNMTYGDRSILASYITGKLIAGCKKFLITHGTDTMEETAHFLTFTLLHPDRQICMTGATFPLDEEDTDAYDNFASTVIALQQNLKGIFVVYDRKIILGPRAAKVDPYSKRAFASKNYSPIGHISRYKFKPTKGALAKIRKINENLRFYIGNEPLYLSQPLHKTVGHLELIADPEPEVLDILFSQKDQDAVVLEAYGSGGIPERWLQSIEKWRKKGKQIIITSRCDQPLITLDYPMMKDAHEMGAIVVYDMLPRVAVVKAMIAATYLNDNSKDFKNFMLGNICGEIDPEIVERYEGRYPSMEELSRIFSILRQREIEFRKKLTLESKLEEEIWISGLTAPASK